MTVLATLPLSSRTYYANTIREAWQQSVESILETGRQLCEAKESLAHGEWEAMCKEDLPFSPQTARKLMAVAQHEVLNRSNWSDLPVAWTSLYELSRFDNDALEAHLASGEIHSDMTGADVLKLRRRELGKQRDAAVAERIAQARDAGVARDCLPQFIVGDAPDVVAGFPDGSIDCVITDPVWPNAPAEMFPECADPFDLLNRTLSALPRSVRRLVIVLRNDSDPRFLQAVPARWPFFHASWLYYVLPGSWGRKLGGNEVAYCFGEPIKSSTGRHLIPGMCQVAAQHVSKDEGHPSPRSPDHMKWLVDWWSDAGETVLDPFCGRGTIASACQSLGRQSVNIDINRDYIRQARARCEADAFQMEAAP